MSEAKKNRNIDVLSTYINLVVVSLFVGGIEFYRRIE